MTDTIRTGTIRTGTPARRRSPGHALLRGRLGRAALGRSRDHFCAATGPRTGEYVFALADARPIEGDGLRPGSRVCANLDLHHDGEAAKLCREAAPGPGAGLTISCAGFGGSYVSLAAAVPEALTARFGPGRVLQLLVGVDTSRPLTTFLRLNIGSADGHEVFHETMIVHRGARSGTFDLDGVRLPFDGRLHAWADIIFSRPETAQITISDLRLRLVGKDAL